MLLGLQVFIVLHSAVHVHSWLDNCGESKYPDAGTPPSEYIVGGWEARPYEFPWQISMHRLRESGEFTHSCGGQVINEYWILTAAHCVDASETNTLQIQIGAHNFTAPDYDVLQMHTVAEIIYHEAYNPDTTENDIALLRLTEQVTFSENVQPVCKPDASVDYTGRECVVSGWGSLNYAVDPDNRILPDTLQFARVPITNMDDCRRRYEFLGYTLTDDMLCAGRINETEYDACQGDSGGPLVCLDEDGTHEIVGVVSWGFGCANRAPGIYARVTHFLDWIDDKLGLN